MPPTAPLFPQSIFYEPLELHIIIQTIIIQTPQESLMSYREEKTPYIVEKTWALSIMYDFSNVDPQD